MVIYAEDRSCVTQFELGELFEKGEPRTRDLEQAFNWYERAAKNGSRQAQHCLANLYARGEGVKQNYAKAYAWCKLAVFQNSKRARRKLRVIERRMNMQQLRQGRLLAQNYYDSIVASQQD